MDVPIPDAALKPPGSDDTNTAQHSRQAVPTVFETYRSIRRLLIGLVLIGGDDLVARLHEWETSQSREPAEPAAEAESGSAAGAAFRALFGLVSETADSTARVLSASARAVQAVGGAVDTAVRPVADSVLFRPVRAPLERLTGLGQQSYQRLVRAGRAEGQRSRRLAANVTAMLLEDIVGFAGDNPGVKALIAAQVDLLLPTLVADPTIQALLVKQLGDWTSDLATRPEVLDPLVQQLGDRYIAYLNEHPDDVQNLIQGQAMSMAGEATDSVRKFTVTGDSFLEAVARGLLRRPPREDLPPADVRLRNVPFSTAGGATQPGEGTA